MATKDPRDASPQQKPGTPKQVFDAFSGVVVDFDQQLYNCLLYTSDAADDFAVV